MSNETNQNTKIYYSDNVKRLTDTESSAVNSQHAAYLWILYPNPRWTLLIFHELD